MKQVFTKQNWLRAVVFTGFLAFIAFSSCKKKDKEDEDPEPTSKVNYAISNVAGIGAASTTYVLGLKDLNTSEVNNDNATELPAFASMWRYKDAVFMTRSGAPATMYKYTFDNEGLPVESGILEVAGSNTFSTVVFIDDNQAYASLGGGQSKLIQFNPTSYQITGEVDLSSVQKEGFTPWYLGAMERDGKLFGAVNYTGAGSPDSAYVAVIDVASGQLEKVMRDGRTRGIFTSGAAVNAFVKDIHGDIYVQADGGGEKPGGILRIKNGQTNFDPDYFFNFPEVLGAPGKGLYHFGNGLTFTTRIDEPTQFWTGYSSKFVKIDLNTKTAQELPGLPLIRASSASLMRKFDDNEILFSVAAAEENAVYSYKISSGQINRKFTLEGFCTGLEKLH
ncbi:MAG: hypothetical protein ACK4ND_09390 [Cytophagaceae bacterium]